MQSRRKTVYALAPAMSMGGNAYFRRCCNCRRKVISRVVLLDEMMLDGKMRRSSSGAHSELTVDRGKMGMDGSRTYYKVLGDLSIGQSLGNQAQHGELTLA